MKYPKKVRSMTETSRWVGVRGCTFLEVVVVGFGGLLLEVVVVCGGEGVMWVSIHKG